MNTSSRTHSLHPIARAARIALGLLMLPLGPLALAAPQGGVVSAGQANVSRNGNLTSVQQQSARAVIDWRSFNLATNEAIDFRQPDARSVTLNRVGGGEPSAILGRITANGNVFLVNPNGILFGAGAQVNVGGLVASTANISTANFMAGDYRFDQPGNPSAKVENHGTIRVADAGIAALVGRQVANSGFIVARLGKVALAGGDTFVLDLAGDRLVNLMLGPADLEKVVDANGLPLTARVDNTGSIRAEGSLVQLSAATVSKLLDNVINVQGDVRATSVGARDGVISLTGGGSADVVVGGVVQAGRRVEVDGRNVTLAGTAQVDLGGGADLKVLSSRNTKIEAELNALREGPPSVSTVEIDAGGDLIVNRNVALAGGVLDLTAGGLLQAMQGVTLQTTTQSLTLSGGTGVAVDRVLSAGAVYIRSNSGAVTVASPIVAPSNGSDAAPVASLLIRAGTSASIAGVLATGKIEVQGGGDLALGASSLVSLDGEVMARAGGALTLKTVSASKGIDLSSGLSLSVAEVLGSGIEGKSEFIRANAGGDLLLAGARAGSLGIEVASQHGSIVSGNLLGDGGVSLVASEGAVGTVGRQIGIRAGPAAPVFVDGRDGVFLSSVLTTGQVTLTSSGGEIVAGTIAGTPGLIGTADPSASVKVQAAGAIQLGGVRAGPGGISVSGAGGSGGAGSFSLLRGSLMSMGPIYIDSRADVTLAASVQSDGDIKVRSREGGVTVGSGGVHSSGRGSLQLDADGDVTLTGSLSIEGGRIDVTSVDGSVRAHVSSPGEVTKASDAFLDAGSDSASSIIRVATLGQGDVVLGGMKAAAGIEVMSESGDVQLLSPLGGDRTGYGYLALGYEDGLRPEVGWLKVKAQHGSVELNGLNLDGQRDPHADGFGLDVYADRYLVSNAKIAVNKGHVRLVGGKRDGEGVFLGDAVYSRGWDHGEVSCEGDACPVRARTSGYEKVGYSILIEGSVLGLFDNTPDVANVPGLYRVKLMNGTTDSVLVNARGYLVDQNNRYLDDQNNIVLAPSRVVTCSVSAGCSIEPALASADGAGMDSVFGEAVHRQIAKIEISNNAANYTDSDALVAATELKALRPGDAGGMLVLDTARIDGLNRPTGGSGRLDVKSLQPEFIPLSEVKSQNRGADASMAAPVVSNEGIALKLLAFDSALDRPTALWSQGWWLGGSLNVAQQTASTPPSEPPGSGKNYILVGEVEISNVKDGEKQAGIGVVGVPSRDGAFTVTLTGGENQQVWRVRDVTQPEDQWEPVVFGADEKVVYHFKPSTSPYYVQLESIEYPAGYASQGVMVSKAFFAETPLQKDHFLALLMPRGRSSSLIPGSAGLVRVSGRIEGESGERIPVQGSASANLPQQGANPPEAPYVNAPKTRQEFDGAVATYESVGDRPDGTKVYQVQGSMVQTTGATTSASTKGTRMLVFDGVLMTNESRPVADTLNGSFMPGSIGTLMGANSSTTGFASVVTESFRPVGAVVPVSTNSSSSSGLVGVSGSGFSAGAVPAGSLPMDPGFMFQPDPFIPPADANRAATDALTLPIGNAAVLSQLQQSVEWGMSPASQADLGRYGSVPGAARNVFQRNYRLAATEDGVACVPGTISPAGGGTSDDGKPSAPSGGAVRVCAP